MNREIVTIGRVEAVHSTTGRLTGYRQEIRHDGLHEHRLLRAPDQYVLQSKATTQLAAWDEKCRRTTQKAAAFESLFNSKHQADILTKEATVAIEQAKDLLVNSLKSNPSIPWAKLGNIGSYQFEHRNQFPGITFGEAGKPLHSSYIQEPPEPKTAEFAPQMTFLGKFLPSIRRRRVAQAKARFEAAHAEWRLACDSTKATNRRDDDTFQRANSEFSNGLNDFEMRCSAAKRRIADLKASYEAMDSAAVVTVADLILTKSRYPKWITRDFSTGYYPDTGLLILDDTLPAVDALPRISKVTYVASRNEMRTAYLSDTERDRLYDSVLYQIALRSIHELFGGDKAGAIKAIVYNGWLTWVNKATGIEETGCLLSLQASREEMSRIDLSKVDPRACFKQLKGIAASKLSGITPVAPIARMNTNDARFVASHEVVSRLDEGVNLASIDWEDFEHLVREIFEREFATEGSEVKVTRASADGGVDAVVFDPDPIRGGKIIIQAKRYTATVGVSAVRDLHGTMLNEGAMKGILVTTSDYGPDSYSFATDKPITLLSSGNLLQMMAKHGHKARIDLAEARRLRVAG